MESPAILSANSTLHSGDFMGAHASCFPPSSSANQPTMFLGSFMWGSGVCL